MNPLAIVAIVISAIAALIGVLNFLDNRFVSGRKQENRFTIIEEAVKKHDKMEGRIEQLFENKVRFDIWWKVFEQKAMSGLHHPERSRLDYFIDNYADLNQEELREFADNLEALADDPATPADEKFLALGLFVQVQTKIELKKCVQSASS